MGPSSTLPAFALELNSQEQNSEAREILYCYIGNYSATQLTYLDSYEW